jgi:arginyl-tRNA synthetase
MPEDAYQGVDIIEHAEAFRALYGDKYVNCDRKERRDALVNYALPKNIAGLERDLKKYRIVYDNWYRESTLHQNGSVKKVVEELTNRGYTYEQDGAVWFKATDFGADKDFVALNQTAFRLILYRISLIIMTSWKPESLTVPLIFWVLTITAMCHG